MKKWMFFSMVIALMPLSMMAQDDDDMYFASSKKSKAQAKVSDRQVRTSEIPTYYVGSSRSVDEYNRMGSRYEIIAADNSDIITFHVPLIKHKLQTTNSSPLYGGTEGGHQYGPYYRPIWPILPTNMAHITLQNGCRHYCSQCG